MRKTRWLSLVAALCGATALPGCAEDPFDLGQPRSCEVGDQNEWVYAAMQELYLFSAEMPEVDPRAYETPADLVRDLRVDPDRWSRVSDKVATEALFQEGKFIGFGYRTKRDAEGNVIIADVHEASPAGRAGLQRGDQILEIGGYTIAQLDEQELWGEVSGEKLPGVSAQFRMQTLAGDEVELVLTKDWIDIITVPIHDIFEVGDRKVGYVFFMTFVGPAFEELDAAFADFRAAGVTDVIVDVRYNGGGLISVSRHLVNLLVGGEADGQVQYQIKYNEQLASNNSRREVSRVEQSLDTVDTVAFLTTGSSLSASELLINSVRPLAHVEIVGSTTGGKPVGSKHLSFCESVLAPITFQLVNGADQGGYFDGIDPTCVAYDDLSQPLGDPAEGTLAAALSVIGGQGCPALPELPGAAPQRDRDAMERQREDGIVELAGWR